MELERGSAEVNGTRLNYAMSGNGAPLVFVHGLTLDLRMWDDQIKFFSKRFRVLSYDLRGFGSSANPEIGAPYSHADDLLSLMSNFGIDRASVVGLSMGGWIAQEFALKHPDAVDALVLVDSSLGGYQFNPSFSATLNSLFSLGRDGRLTECKAKWVGDPLFSFSGTVPGVSNRLRQIVDDYSSWGLLHDDPHQGLNPPTKDLLDRIAAKTLVIVGAHDLPDFQTIADLLTAGIPGARKVVLADAGHMANMDAPEAFNAAVMEFVAPISS